MLICSLESLRIAIGNTYRALNIVRSKGAYDPFYFLKYYLNYNIVYYLYDSVFTLHNELIYSHKNCGKGVFYTERINIMLNRNNIGEAIGRNYSFRIRLHFQEACQIFKIYVRSYWYIEPRTIEPRTIEPRTIEQRTIGPKYN